MINLELDDEEAAMVREALLAVNVPGVRTRLHARLLNKIDEAIEPADKPPASV